MTFRYKGCIYEEEKEVDSSEKSVITLGDGDSLMGKTQTNINDLKYMYSTGTLDHLQVQEDIIQILFNRYQYKMP